ncbi:MAG: M48 family metallopeptidase [Alphaproteobacteria bacterium]
MGDAVLAVEGIPIPAEQGALAKVFAELREDGIDESLTLTVRSWGEDERDVTINSEPICDYDLHYLVNDLVNAHADGDNVVIYSGMTRFAVKDTELAAIIGHEIAHNAMGHIDAKKINSVAGAGVGLLFEILAPAAGVNTGGELMRAGANIGAGAYSKEFEAEADYVGLYLMARAGMSIEEVPNFWRRMAVSHPGSIASNHGATHPATPERFLALATAVEAINGKIAVGAALMPDMAIEPSPRTTAYGASSGTAFKSGSPVPE